MYFINKKKAIKRKILVKKNVKINNHHISNDHKKLTGHHVRIYPHYAFRFRNQIIQKPKKNVFYQKLLRNKKDF